MQLYINKLFGKYSRYHKALNRNTGKLSNSCMPIAQYRDDHQEPKHETAEHRNKKS